MLTSRVALVTGGASGLGKATVERFIREGGRVTLVDLPTSDGAKVAETLGENAVFAAADVTSEKDVQAAVDLTKAKFGRLDVVVNCAGLSLGSKLTYDFSAGEPHKLEDFVNMMMVNTVGTFNVARLAVALIGSNEPDQSGQRGIVINTASVLAFDGPRSRVGYAASKAAVAGMTLPMARDLGPQGIRVVSIAPGMFDTPMLTCVPEIVRAALAKAVPCPSRVGHPDEFAFLIQSIILNPMLNGDTIRLDGASRLNNVQ